ncbi:hypothetical protein IMZ11_02755 [Microtetraspora sp. AC03309]|uniref:hypothetical protein n=1 Tax=Microtetraspora sp. AC03309 TaxID=2779376 RepID=UPI001E55438A|nr:hypothetical protein [Microtetraspora sp. AC03309]MCC5574560.1 hypothetical protein [Microtetraspora sp. AC03309]
MTTPKVHALKVAAAKVLAGIVTEGYEQIRKDAEPVFAELRIETDAKSLSPSLPDGTELGTISIKAGPSKMKFRMSTLAAIVANDDPEMFEERLTSEAVTDPELLQFVRDHMPHLMERRINDKHLRVLFKATDANGHLKDAAGTPIQVADVTRGEPTGEFSYRASVGAREAVWAAWQAGELQPLIGDLLRPALETGEGE